jgi:hypothetical protein
MEDPMLQADIMPDCPQRWWIGSRLWNGQIIQGVDILLEGVLVAIGSATTRYFCLQRAYIFINIRQWNEDPSAM